MHHSHYCGLKTLALRVKHQNNSALKIAQFLKQYPAVAKVNYPGHKRAVQLFNVFSGMLSFELHGGLKAVEQLFS